MLRELASDCRSWTDVIGTSSQATPVLGSPFRPALDVPEVPPIVHSDWRHARARSAVMRRNGFSAGAGGAAATPPRRWSRSHSKLISCALPNCSWKQSFSSPVASSEPSCLHSHALKPDDVSKTLIARGKRVGQRHPEPTAAALALNVRQRGFIRINIADLLGTEISVARCAILIKPARRLVDAIQNVFEVMMHRGSHYCGKPTITRRGRGASRSHRSWELSPIDKPDRPPSLMPCCIGLSQVCETKRLNRRRRRKSRQCQYGDRYINGIAFPQDAKPSTLSARSLAADCNRSIPVGTLPPDTGRS